MLTLPPDSNLVPAVVRHADNATRLRLCVLHPQTCTSVQDATGWSPEAIDAALRRPGCASHMQTLSRDRDFCEMLKRRTQALQTDPLLWLSILDAVYTSVGGSGWSFADSGVCQLPSLEESVRCTSSWGFDARSRSVTVQVRALLPCGVAMEATGEYCMERAGGPGNRAVFVGGAALGLSLGGVRALHLSAAGYHPKVWEDRPWNRLSEPSKLAALCVMMALPMPGGLPEMALCSALPRVFPPARAGRKRLRPQDT